MSNNSMQILHSQISKVFSVFLKEMENYLNVISVSTTKKALRTVTICSAFGLFLNIF